MTTDPTDQLREARERMSALLDAELEGNEYDRALRELSQHSNLCKTWERYHLIGSCLRREPMTLRPDLAARVAERLAEESIPDPLPAVADDSARRRRTWYPVALAASVLALVAGTLVIQDLRVSPPAPEVAAVAAESSNATRWHTADPGHEDALNAFLVEHSEFTSSPGMNGLASYAKFVSYDTAR